MQTQSRVRRNDAFTIIELLVATAVTAVLAGLMIAMISGVLTAWNRTSGSLQTNNDAKLISDLLREDLGAAVRKNDGNVWLAIDVLHKGVYTEAKLASDHGWITTADPSTDLIKPEDPTTISTADTLDMEATNLEDTRYGVGGAWLRFFTGSSGSVSAVSYQIVRRHILDFPGPTNPSEIRYMLMRSEVPSAGIVDAGAGGGAANDDGYDLTPAATLYEYPSYGTAGGHLENPPTRSVIATNVIDFGVRFYVRNHTTNNLNLVFPANNATPPTLDNAHRQFLAGGTGANIPPYPEVADIFVRVLTEEGAELIENLESGRITGDWWEIAMANSRVYTQRIRIGTESE